MSVLQGKKDWPLKWQRQAADGYTVVPVVVHISKDHDPFVCQHSASELCGGKDEVSKEKEVRFPTVKGTSTFDDDSDSRARFTFDATYLKFTHDVLEVHTITHAPIVPIDGIVYFPLRHHVFESGSAASTRQPGAVRDVRLLHSILCRVCCQQ